MPPIPVHIDDPITPKKPDGVTPQTSEQGAAPPANNITTAAQHASSAYPSSRPGAAAMPAPTSYIPRPAPEVTRTQAQADPNVPPPPQPGAVPVPFGQQVPMSASSTLPPPPKPGEAWKQQTTLPPSQMQVPPPMQNHAPTHSTSAYLPPQGTGPTTVNLGPVNSQSQAQHSAGYQQNTSAQEMTSVQRSSLDGQERREGVMGNLGVDGEKMGETVEGMWNTVKGWASVAGEKLVETEGEVWRRINGK